MNRIRVYCNNTRVWRRSAPRLGKEMTLPCIVLEHDNWDDFSYKTSYNIAIYDKKGSIIHEGFIKILEEEGYITELPSEFTSLPNSYCSLWQNINDYIRINELDYGHLLLKTLNDINYNQVLREKFLTHRGLQDSLKRFSEAERAFQEGPKILSNIKDTSNFAFSYMEGSKSSTPFGTIEFNFSRKLLGLYRVIGIIGRNGVGKTTLLANLALSLSGIKKSEIVLSPRPPFGKIIAVSYSTFDDFYRPKSNERTFSYYYCGIRGDEDLLSQGEINRIFNNSFKKAEKSRIDFWENCMNILYNNRFESYFPDFEKVMHHFKRLSSGQKIMTTILTQIISEIETNSILLFDEPEIHLHPNGQNTLFACLDYILQKFDSYAIISTHSPIFIQNIPCENVLKLSSVKGIRSTKKLKIEYFGQHFSKLTEEIFGFAEDNMYYVEKLKEIYDSRFDLGSEYDELFSIDSIGAQYHLKLFNND